MSEEIQERLEKIEKKIHTALKSISLLSKQIQLGLDGHAEQAAMIMKLSDYTKEVVASAVASVHYIEEKQALSALYYSIFMGALVGVVGNFFASFWFQPRTEWTIAGLAVSGLMLFVIFCALWIRFRRARAVSNQIKQL